MGRSENEKQNGERKKKQYNLITVWRKKMLKFAVLSHGRKANE